MKLIVGLGNPGKKYETTRHNAGFLVVDRMQAEHEFPAWAERKKFHADYSGGFIDEESVFLVEPQTFMNESGRSVQAAMSFYKLKPADIIVVHDELDLPLGTIRIQQAGRAAGHNGIQSIIDAIGLDFIRLRIGIHTETMRGKPSEVTVLEKFSSAEKKILASVLDTAVEALACIVTDGAAKAMTRFNGKK